MRQIPVAVFTVLLVVIIPGHLTHAQFHTNWDAPFLYECPLGLVLKSIHSVHDNRKEDRRWRFGCGIAASGCKLRACHWTDYVNWWDAPMNFVCPANYVISGLQSYHDNHREDRRFKFKCCSHRHYITYSCSLTGYINNWDAVLNYNVPRGHVLTGVAGVHDNRKE
ncbi:hemagglutinin/amebocyte aggregation factor [Elysia marginata]|uniref:Hemagglutinin/amebocyte aggregation factor n=1 Tax=Elysia marginata TaxID=1093978 RepID=A0AAV4IWD7_9GAST|nr:hemagglutinin/amebocyte aggregation factor [Elysia marginata]